MLPTITRAEAAAGRFFDARPAKVQDLLRARDPVVLACGPLGTGKTTACLERVRACCLKYAGCRWLLLRSVRKWLTNSALVTWEQKVVLPSELMPDRIHRSSRSEYRFRNGSTVVVAGLDNPVAVRSADYDGAFLLEATEVQREATEEVQGRLRNGRMPYQQMLMDCNPGPPTHWLKQDVDAERLRCINTTHRDNPYLFDPVRQDWTEIGRQYVERLETSLTGSRLERLFKGKWVQSEGVVYDEWIAATHVVEPFPIPPHWKRYIIVDFGFNDPMVVQWHAIDDDDRDYLYREIFTTGRLVEDVAAWAKRMHLMNGDPAPLDVVCDHDREDRGTFERHSGWRTVPANKPIEVGIQDVKARLKIQGDGKPRLFVFRTALCHEPDAKLTELRKPTSTIQEFDGYIWDPRAKKEERPLDKDNHGMDCVRYMARHLVQVSDGSAFDGYGTPSAYKDEYSLPDDTFR
jgi:PBSX family phage terminase large subunit